MIKIPLLSISIIISVVIFSITPVDAQRCSYEPPIPEPEPINILQNNICEKQQDTITITNNDLPNISITDERPYNQNDELPKSTNHARDTTKTEIGHTEDTQNKRSTENDANNNQNKHARVDTTRQIANGTQSINSELYRLINQCNWNINIAFAVMIAESGGNPNIENNTLHKDTGNGRDINGNLVEYSVGLFQINTSAHKEYTPQQLKNKIINIKEACRIYKGNGWRAWGAYTNGSYKKYLRLALNLNLIQNDTNKNIIYATNKR